MVEVAGTLDPSYSGIYVVMKSKQGGITRILGKLMASLQTKTQKELLAATKITGTIKWTKYPHSH